MNRKLRHVTLTTGHVRDSDRSEVDPDVLAVCSHLLAEGATGGTPIVPAVKPDCTLRVTRSGRCWRVTVDGPGGAPLVTIGIAGHSRCGGPLWRSLHEDGYALATDPLRPAAEPWCAVRLELGLGLHPEAAHWLGDFERCLAWAALDGPKIS